MKKNGLIILLIVLLTLLILIGGFITITLLDLKSGVEGNTEEEESEPVELYKFSLEKSVITNVKDSKKYIRCNIVIQLSNYEDSVKLQENSFKVEDILISILRGIKEEEYKEINIQHKISSMVRSSIEEEMKVTSITKIYFSELITQ